MHVMPQKLKDMLLHLINVLFPYNCVSCENSTNNNSYLCDSCRSQILFRRANEGCSICGKNAETPHHTEQADYVCGQCKKQKPKFDKARSAAEFKYGVRSMTLKFKYNKKLWVADELTSLLHACVIANFNIEEIDMVCPVPLNHNKLRERGYNQSQILGEKLAHQLKIAFVPNIIERTRNTPTQTRMNIKERHENVKQAFISPKRFQKLVYGKTILLVDDVMTTGATLSECAAALKANGAWRVFTVTVAGD